MNKQKIRVTGQNVLKNMTVSQMEISTDDEEDRKAELKIYNVSQKKKRGATIEIRQLSNYSYEDVEYLKDILLSLLNEIMKQEDGSKITFLKCDICDWKTREKKLLTAHRKKMHGVLVTSIRCDNCEFVTSKLLDMDNHKTLKHINGVSVTSTDFTNKDESRKRAKTNS